MAEAPAPPWRAAAMPAVLLAGLAVAAHASGFAGDFQFDDYRVVVDDPRVRSFGAWWASMPGIRPLLKLTFAANHASELGLFGFHAFNIAVHAANAVLVYLLLARLERRVAGSAGARLGAWLGAAIFALHPVQTEAVTYVSGRSSSLVATFLLASAIAWLVGRDANRPALTHAVSPALFVAALGVKELAVFLPLGLVLAGRAGAREPAAATVRATAVHWAVLAFGAGAMLATERYRWMLEQSFALRSFVLNVLSHARGILWLAGQLVPVRGLDADPALPAVAAPGAGALVPLAVIVLAIAAAARSWTRAPRASFAVLWFLLWAAPAGWIVPRPEVVNERQLYLALAGPAWLAGAALARRIEGGRRAVAAASAALLVVLGAGTVVRNRVYENEVRFWEDAVKGPPRAEAFSNLGYAYARACDFAAAEAAFRRALELDPMLGTAAVNLKLLREGDLLDGADAARCAGVAGEERYSLERSGP